MKTRQTAVGCRWPLHSSRSSARGLPRQRASRRNGSRRRGWNLAVELEHTRTSSSRRAPGARRRPGVPHTPARTGRQGQRGRLLHLAGGEQFQVPALGASERLYLPPGSAHTLGTPENPPLQRALDPACVTTRVLAGVLYETLHQTDCAAMSARVVAHPASVGNGAHVRDGAGGTSWSVIGTTSRACGRARVRGRRPARRRGGAPASGLGQAGCHSSTRLPWGSVTQPNRPTPSMS
ncbi:hypothetical protein SRB17_47790 [Streptomyces sp. RB17]|nr:hypothetical protein [Streptomyces sp. RB17]